MGNKTELRSGRTYILDDFTVVQVASIKGERVDYRTRAWTWTWRRRTVTRRTSVKRLEPRVLAEVNGDFFPDVVVPGLHRFERPADEAARLDAHLTERAARRPFAGDG